MARIKTIDAEVGGEAVRLIISGAPAFPGRTMIEKLNALRKRGGELRRLLMLEPRGHSGMHGAMLTTPVSPNAHAGILSMHAGGFPLVSGEGIVGALTIALENRLIEGIADEVIVDTPSGVFRARPRRSGTQVTSVAVTGVPSFVHSAGLPLRFGARDIIADVAFGGEFYVIADSEAVGIPLDVANADALIRAGRDIKEAAESAVSCRHPRMAGIQGIHGTILTGAARGEADLRSATVLDGSVLRRSPGITGTAALIAILDAMGLLDDARRFTHEGVLGTIVQGGVIERRSAEPAEVVPVIEASASITGYHEFVSGQLDSVEAT
jgi:proline racemase